MLLEDKLERLDTAALHIGRAYDTLFALGYTGLGNALLELLDEVSEEMGNLEAELDEQEAE